MVWGFILFVLAAVVRGESTPKPTYYPGSNNSVYASDCESGYYRNSDNGCNELSGNSSDYSIGTDGPDAEGFYCCDSTCSDCTSYASDDFVEFNDTEVQLIAKASQHFVLETKAYISIGEISKNQLRFVFFTLEYSNGTEITTIHCDVDTGNNCADGFYSIDNTTYALSIFNPTIPVFRIKTEFVKVTPASTGSYKYVQIFGPKFIVRVQPTVTLSIDKESYNVTCSTQTSVPATLMLFLNGTPVVGPKKFQATNFSDSYTLPPGEQHVKCEVTGKFLDNVTFNSSDSQQYSIPLPPTSVRITTGTPIPTTSSPTATPAGTPFPTTSSPTATTPKTFVVGIIAATSVLAVIIGVIFILVILIFIYIVCKNKATARIDIEQ